MKKYFANSEKAARNFLKSVGLYPKKSQASCACGETLAYDGINDAGEIEFTVVVCENCFSNAPILERID